MNKQKKTIAKFFSLLLAVFLLSHSVQSAYAATKNENNPFSSNPGLRYSNEIIFVGENNLCGTNGAATEQTATQTNGTIDLDSVVNKYNLQSAIVMKLSGGLVAEHNSSKPPSAPASTMKLIVADVALREKINWDENVTVTSDVRYDSNNADPIKVGTTVSYRQALNLMLSKSSNVGANLLIKKLGGYGTPVTAKVEAAGYKKTKINAYYSDPHRGSGDNTSTIADQANAMQHIQTTSGDDYAIAKNALGLGAKNNNQYDLDDYKNKWGGTSTIASNVGAFVIGDEKYIIGSYHEGDPFTSDVAYKAMHDGTGEIISLIEKAPAGAATEQSQPATASDSGALYMLGDSITLGAKDSLDQELKAKNIPTYINASKSRSISGEGETEGYKTDGMDALEGDKNRVKNAGTVVVALGTNPEGDFKTKAKNLIGRIKEYNSAAKIYWVNVFSDVSHKTSTNKTLQELGSSENVNIIDMTDKNIPLSGDDIHPTTEGSEKFAASVAASVEGNASNSVVSSSCVCGTSNSGGDGGADLSGEQAELFIFKYLISKGLEPWQAAGMLGNMHEESTYNPQRLQNTPVDKRTPAESLTPEQLGDNDLGWGLVQFTPPGKYITTIEPRTDANKITTQLDFILKQFETNEKPAGDKLKATRTPREAATSFELDYERHAGGAQPARGDKAEDVMSRLGSTTGGASSGSSSGVSCSTAEGSGEVTGEYSLPLAKKWYDQHKDWFTKDHHLHSNGSPDNASDIPVPTGTPVYSITAGKIISAPNEGGYGRGVTIDAGNGILIFYGHGSDGGSVKNAKQGDTVKPGQLIMHSASTGNSTGPHLHVGISVSGTYVCPQNLFVGIAEGNPPDIASLPKTGCSSGGL